MRLSHCAGLFRGRDSDTDASPFARFGTNRKGAAQQSGPFPHAQEPQASSFRHGAFEFIRIESLSIVFHVEGNLISAEVEWDLHTLRIRMPLDVGDRFLADTVQGGFYFRPQAALRPGDLDGEVEAVRLQVALGRKAQSRRQAEVIEHRGTE